MGLSKVVDTDAVVKNIHKICQFSYNDKLITLIGEMHMDDFVCDRKTVSVENYVSCVLKYNKGSLVFLEAPATGVDPLSINSEPIKKIYRDMKQAKLLDRIVPFDIRKEFIGYPNQQFLYTKDMSIVSHDDIVKFYITPFFEKYERILDIKEHKDRYDPDIYKFLTVSYVNGIKQKLIDVKKNIKIYPVSKIQTSLQYAWMAVTDYYMLVSILMRDRKRNEYIIVAGLNHVNNMSQVIGHLINKKPNLGISKLFDLSYQNHEKSCIQLSGLYVQSLDIELHSNEK